MADNLPSNGTVVIIDDRIEEAMPIIQALARQGIPTTFYTGINNEEFPELPVQNVRVIFLDLQLLDAITNEDDNARLLIDKLSRIVPPNNGPYLLIVWSKHYHIFGTAFEEEINSNENLRPSSIISFDKRECLEETTVEPIPIQIAIETLSDSLIGSFSEEEQNQIIEITQDVLQSFNATTWVALPNAVEIIDNHIRDALLANGCFHLYVIWENVVNKAAIETTSDISNVIPNDNNWEENMKNIFHRMGKARVSTNEVDNNDRLLKEALVTLNQVCTETIEGKLRTMQLPPHIDCRTTILIKHEVGTSTYCLEYNESNKKYFVSHNGSQLGQQKEVRKIGELAVGVNNQHKPHLETLIATHQDKIKTLLNTRLHIELNHLTDILPGNVYELTVHGATKKKLLSTYLKNYVTQVRGKTKQIKFIELEVSPICDYAQGKWLKNRLISGILLPQEFWNLMKPLSQFSHYIVEPELKFKGKVYKMVLSHLLFKSVDYGDLTVRGELLFRIKRGLLLDIISRLSAHVNRPGIITVV